MSEDVSIPVGRLVLDKGLLDRDGRRCGKVDDLLLELEPDGELRVVGVVSGPLAFAQTLGPLWRAVSRAVHRLLGVANPRPVEIPWTSVDAVDFVVRLSVSRREAGLEELADAVRRRIVSRIPGA